MDRPAFSRLLVMEAALWLCAARLLLWLVPFPRIGRRLGVLRPPSSAHTSRRHEPKAAAVAHAVKRAAQLLPFSCVCLPCALAGSQMLSLRGIASELHFGAARQLRGQEPVSVLHAWLTCGASEVTGFPVASSAVELGLYARTGVTAESRPEWAFRSSGEAE